VRNRYAGTIFENKQLTNSNRQLAKLAKTNSKERVCDPLPTGHLERENKAEIDRDWSPEKRKKEGLTSFRQAFRIGV
jgi:hypothetical protein